MNEEQKQIAETWKSEIEEKKKRQVNTDILPATLFTNAEDYHQKFRLRNSEFFDDFKHLNSEEFINSFGGRSQTISKKKKKSKKPLLFLKTAAKVNGFVSGSGDLEVFKSVEDKLGLKPARLEKLRKAAQNYFL